MPAPVIYVLKGENSKNQKSKFLVYIVNSVKRKPKAKIAFILLKFSYYFLPHIPRKSDVFSVHFKTNLEERKLVD